MKSKKRPPTAPSWRESLPQRLGFIGITAMTVGLVLILGSKFEQLAPPAPSASVSTAKTNTPSQPVGKVRGKVGSPSSAPTVPAAIATPTPITIPTAVTTPIPPANSYFGHLAYSESPPDDLVSIGKFVRENYEREEFLDGEAAQAFQTMVMAARSQGVQLMGISGFRSIADQQALFAKQIEKRGSAEAAAQLSAPPGHSEHHTGYAIDITDASRTDVDLKVAFEETAAYQWLVANAQNYGFEQSFPRQNTQGVSYEPWHWRFVGSARSAATFAQARSTN